MVNLIRTVPTGLIERLGEPAPIYADKPTLVYIHGQSLSALTSVFLRTHFEVHGYNFAEPLFWPRFQHDEIIPYLAENIDRLTQRIGKPVGLVGFSRGGLIATMLGQNFGFVEEVTGAENPIAAVVSMAAPITGTPKARFSKNAKEMVPGHPQLQETLEKPIFVPSLYLAGEKDWIVPHQYAVWPKPDDLVTNVVMEGRKHLDFIDDHAAFEMARTFFDRHLES